MKIRNPINNCRPGAAPHRPTPARCSSPTRSIPTNYRADRSIHSEGARGFAYGYQTEIHPDKNQDNAEAAALKLARVVEARDCLLDPARRVTFDATTATTNNNDDSNKPGGCDTFTSPAGDCLTESQFVELAPGVRVLRAACGGGGEAVLSSARGKKFLPSSDPAAS